MFKYSFNFVTKSRSFQLLRDCEAFKIFCFKNGMTSYKNINRSKVRSFFKRTDLSPAFQNINFYKKPVVLISGILSFFGFPEKPPEGPELLMRIKKGILLMEKGQYDDAEAMFHLALELAQEEKDEDGITYVYDMLANLAFETGNYSKAEKLFVNVLQRLLSKGEEEYSNKIVHISLKLAKIFKEMKEYKKAEEGFNFCIETMEKKLDDGDQDTLALWGMSMDWYARFLLDLRRKDEALKCFQKAYDICVKLNGMEHEQTAILLNDMGTVSSLMGDTETAMNYFEKARDIGSHLPEMKDLAIIYINLGQIYLLREMYKEGRKACEEGYKLAKSFSYEIGVIEATQCLNTINEVFKNPERKNQIIVIDSDGAGIKEDELVN